VIAFSTASEVRRTRNAPRLSLAELGNEEMNPLFQATVEAIEEAIYNALFMASTVTSNGARVEAIPVDDVKRILARRGVIR
jgi:D-aminopeptidase